MAWTTPRTWVTNEVVTASLLNTHVRDNLAYLFDERPVEYVNYRAGSDYASTSTDFADVDATNLKLTLNLRSGRAVVITRFRAEAEDAVGNYGRFTLEGDGDALGTAYGLAHLVKGEAREIVLVGYWSGLETGSTDFKLQYKSGSSGKWVKIYNTLERILMLGWEV
jgi:hypothetical protein